MTLWPIVRVVAARNLSAVFVSRSSIWRSRPDVLLARLVARLVSRGRLAQSALISSNLRMEHVSRTTIVRIPSIAS